MNRCFGIIEDPLKHEPRTWNRAGIFFASFTLAAVVRFRDDLPQPWPLVLVCVLGVVIVTQSYLLCRATKTAASDSDDRPESDAS